MKKTSVYPSANLAGGLLFFGIWYKICDMHSNYFINLSNNNELKLKRL